ncbi:hypothetical protein G6F49_007756 [Rhizopus delemar]|nr:hypothetical protein G6F49_007756 [Rhizopus delemar]KAG1578463.1 hypothetical protein G6F48_011912 [Rhizopus delemar]KAG1639655.1 hypothetical protein G6F44_007617 [Rhizopus delemar]
MHGESASVDITSENIQNELRKIEELLELYDPIDIMNFDETGIVDNFKAYFRAQQHDRALCLYISKKLDNPNVYKMDQAQAMFSLANEWLKVKPETTKGMLPDLRRNFDNKVTDFSQLNLEADESEMIVCYTTSTTNNEETAEGNIDKAEENDNTEQGEQRVDIVEFLLDDLDRKLHRRIRMRLADSCAELNKSKEQTDLGSYFINLCSFHLVCRIVPEFVQNHERTHFVENIVPSLLALAKITGFIEFKWCEAPFISSKRLNLKGYDYDYRSASSNKLGILKTQNNMELIIAEVSSGTMKENTTYTIEDALKILECSISALRKEVTYYKNASLKTFKKLKIYSLQVIKTQVTLSEMSLFNKTHWKFIEKMVAKLPTNWNDQLCFVQYLELLATLFDSILTTQQIQKQSVKENLGLVEFSGPSVESIIQESHVI